MTIERYSHVMHLVSHVRGRLAKGKDCFDAFERVPCWHLDRAPKIRAMEIIEDLEPDRRGRTAVLSATSGFRVTWTWPSPSGLFLPCPERSISRWVLASWRTRGRRANTRNA